MNRNLLSSYKSALALTSLKKAFFLQLFESTAYRDGRQATHCGIWRGRRGNGLGDICYGSSGISENSCNESMSIAENSQLIGFRPLMGVGGVGGRRDQLLTNEGMAEHLWNLFVTPLKQRW